MDAYNSFDIAYKYSDTDCYIRAVRLNMIRRNGEIKDAAFKSRKGGVSVTRSNEELLEYALAYMKSHFDGVMAKFPVTVCKEASIFEKHSPSQGHNMHHWELYGSQKEDGLSDEQIDTLINSVY